MIDAIVGYLQDFAIKSETIYHVNPWIFGILFFGSAVPLYYGYFLIGRSVLKFEKRKFKRKKVDKKELRLGVIISSVSWLLPYAYIILFGRLPLYLFVIFIFIISIIGLMFIKTLKKRISNTINQ
ncbi:MAG: hypothetical protein WCK26_01805 [Candidatus Saccharibacteria bacterium]